MWDTKTKFKKNITQTWVGICEKCKHPNKIAVPSDDINWELAYYEMEHKYYELRKELYKIADDVGEIVSCMVRIKCNDKIKELQKERE